MNREGARRRARARGYICARHTTLGRRFARDFGAFVFISRCFRNDIIREAPPSWRKYAMMPTDLPPTSRLAQTMRAPLAIECLMPENFIFDAAVPADIRRMLI